MRRRSVEPAGSRRADLRRGLAAPTPTVAAALAGPRLTHNPSRSTVEPENGGYLGDVGLGCFAMPATLSRPKLLFGKGRHGDFLVSDGLPDHLTPLVAILGRSFLRQFKLPSGQE